MAHAFSGDKNIDTEKQMRDSFDRHATVLEERHGPGTGDGFLVQLVGALSDRTDIEDRQEALDVLGGIRVLPHNAQHDAAALTWHVFSEYGQLVEYVLIQQHGLSVPGSC
jgi:hypothetical protein